MSTSAGTARQFRCFAARLFHPALEHELQRRGDQILPQLLFTGSAG